MNDSVFMDTSGWIALLNSDDQFHQSAEELLEQISAQRRTLLTTTWVFAETGNGLARTRIRARFADVVRAFLKSPNSRLIRMDDSLFGRALEMYEQTTDKTWGLIDCSSFVVMRDHGLSDAFTNDRHFQQAGFRCLLSPSA